MNQKYARNDLRHRVSEIISAIDLNYILAEARKEKYKVSLNHGILKNHIKWSIDTCHLSYNYEISTGIIHQFLSIHYDKIIKINISSNNDILPLNRNIIIYIPSKTDLERIKQEYISVVI